MEDITNTQRPFKAVSSTLHGDPLREPLQNVSRGNAHAEQSIAGADCQEKSRLALEKAAVARSHILNQASTPQLDRGFDGRAAPSQVGIMQTPVAHFSFESPELLGQFSNIRKQSVKAALRTIDGSATQVSLGAALHDQENMFQSL